MGTISNTNMARGAVLVFLVGVVGATYGFEFPDVKEFISSIKEVPSKVNTIASEYLTPPGFQCIDSEGKYKNPQHCDAYIHCIKGLPFPMLCPSGQHFNEKTKQCEIPCDAHCDERLAEDCGWKKDEIEDSPYDPYNPIFPVPPFFRCIDKNRKYRHPNTCHAYIYCARGYPVVIICDIYHHFNEETGECDTPCNAHCDENLAEECGWSEAEIKKSHTELPTEDPLVDSQYDQGYLCSNNGLLPISGSCTEYIQCLSQIQYDMECPDGLHFSPEKRKCLPPCEAHCDRAYAARCGWKKSQSFGSQESLETTTEYPYEIADYPCPKNGLYASQVVCSTFIECSNGRAYGHVCPAGMHFSEEMQWCDTPCNARCDQSLAEECRWTEEEIRNSHKTALAEPPCARIICKEGCYLDDSEPCRRCICPDDSKSPAPPSDTCIEDVLYPHRYKCGNYFKCSNGFLLHKRCKKGLHFNKRTQRCEHPCDARCEPSIAEECGWNEEPQKSTSYDICNLPGLRGPCRGSMKRWHFDSELGACASFTYGGCGGNKNNFETKEDCETACLTDDQITSSPFFNCVEDGRYPNPDDCRSYIDCNNLIPKVYCCDRGLCYNKETQMCDSVCDDDCDPLSDDECQMKTVLHANGLKQQVPCSLPKDKGPCHGTLKRYYYDSTNDVCRSFVYGGCGGNKNNFRRKQDCEEKCLHSEVPFRTTINSGVKLNYDFTCLRDGIYPNPNECSSFIQCSNGLPYEMACPSGLHFHKETKWCEAPCVARCDLSLTEQCGWEESSKYSGYKNQAKYNGKYMSYKKTVVTNVTCLRDGLFANIENCNTYIQCSNGLPNMHSCPEGLHFNEEKQECGSPCDARCDPSIAEECGWEESSSRMYSNSNRRYSSYKKIVATEFSCVRDGMFPNPDNCITYIQCSDGLPHIESCPDGLHFSEKTQRCESPCDAHCDPDIADECHWEESRTEQSPQWWEDCSLKNDDRCSHWVTSKRISIRSTANCDTNGLYSNPENCTTYLQCFNGMPYVLPCPHGLHFNEETQRCVSPCEAHCDPSIAEECHWEHSVMPTGFRQHLRIPNVINNRMIIPDDIRCERERLYPDPTLCHVYYSCLGGQLFYTACLPGLHFSEKDQKCLPPCDAKCDNKLVDQCNWKEEENFKCPAHYGHFGTFDCTMYYECRQGWPMMKQCPQGQAFDHIEGSCVPESSAQCLYKCLKPDRIYPYFPDQQKYIKCVNGIPRVESCPPDQYFNSIGRGCAKLDDTV